MWALSALWPPLRGRFLLHFAAVYAILKATMERVGKKMKRLLIWRLVLLLTVPALAEAPSALRPRRDEIIEEAPQVALAGVRFEGEGYESPEEAVAAYLQAKKSGDAAGMLATFAIETYVSEMDAQVELERYRAFYPTLGIQMPLGGEYQQQLAVAARYGQLADNLFYQWMLYSWPEGYEEFGGTTISLTEDGAVEAFLAGLAENDAAARWQEMEIVEFVEPAELSDMYLNESNQQNIAKQVASYGCDELVSVAVKLDIGGEEWYQCMNVARYGEKWYNLSLSGNIGILLAMSSYAAGLAPAAELRL